MKNKPTLTVHVIEEPAAPAEPAKIPDATEFRSHDWRDLQRRLEKDQAQRNSVKRPGAG